MTQETQEAVRTGRRTSGVLTTLTVIAAIIATSMSADGMWNVARGSLQLPLVTACGVFLFLELAQVVEAVRARVNYRLTGSTGADGLWMWGFAVINASLSALEAWQVGVLAVLVRVAAPAVAVGLWHRGIVLDESVSHRERLVRKVLRAAHKARQRKPGRRLRYNRRLAYATLNAGTAGVLTPDEITRISYVLGLVRQSDEWRTGGTPCVPGQPEVVRRTTTRTAAAQASDTAQDTGSQPVSLVKKPAAQKLSVRSAPVRAVKADTAELCEVLAQAFPHSIPNRPDAVRTLRTVYGTMSERRADAARRELRGRRDGTNAGVGEGSE